LHHLFHQFDLQVVLVFGCAGLAHLMKYTFHLGTQLT
jgi:hypothetical protein